MAHDKCNYFSFWIIFCPFTPFRAQKIKIKKKMKKTSGGTITLHKCTKNHDHICYTVPEIWCMTDTIVIFILGYFFPFYPPQQPKKSKKFLKMKKTPGDILILHRCTKSYDQMMYGS